MKTSNILTDAQIEEIKRIAKRELTKRGIHAAFEVFEETISNRGSHFFNVHTEEFQTVPVLFESIRIEASSNSISKGKVELNGETFEVSNFWLTLSARYNNFSGGSNGVSVIEMSGSFYGYENLTHDLIIK